MKIYFRFLGPLYKQYEVKINHIWLSKLGKKGAWSLFTKIFFRRYSNLTLVWIYFKRLRLGNALVKSTMEERRGIRGTRRLL